MTKQEIVDLTQKHLLYTIRPWWSKKSMVQFIELLRDLGDKQLLIDSEIEWSKMKQFIIEYTQLEREQKINKLL